MGELVLHIGTHKTGTTSFQRALDSKAAQLEAAAVHPFQSRLTDLRGWAHELPLLAVRQWLNIPLRRYLHESSLPSMQDAMREHVATEMGSSAETVVASHEALSFIRQEHEVETLAALARGRTVKVLLVIRDPATYLASWRAQLERSGWPPQSALPDSCFFTKPGSWLTDYTALINAYSKVLGRDAITVIEYEKAVKDHGTVVGPLWTAGGLPDSVAPESDGAWANVQPSRAQLFLRRARRAAKLLFAAESAAESPRWARQWPVN